MSSLCPGLRRPGGCGTRDERLRDRAERAELLLPRSSARPLQWPHRGPP
jgi:hypothetical protein